MLESIKITNLALIDKSVINFKEGFNVLTGETGAGKSLIVDALLFLTGLRADKTLIKSGQEFARVEGIFSIDMNNQEINEILSSVDIENEGTLIISRYFTLNGKNECRVNGEIVTLNIIRKLSNLVIDIFGQNDSQVLLDSSNHLNLLDSMIEDKLADLKNILNSNLDNLKEINNQIKELGGLDSDREKNIQLLQFQIDEINNANLEDGQEEDIKNKINIMQNSEKIYSGLNQVLDILDGEYNLSNAIKMAINNLSPIESFDDSLSQEKERLYSLKYELDDIVSNISSKKDNITYSENEMDILQDKLSEIKDLERKYGNTIANILDTKVQLEKKLDILINSEQELERLRLNKNSLLKDILTICNDLHNIRKKEIIKIRENLISELKSLGMKSANFDIEFTNSYDLNNIESIVTPDGADKIEFMFSANLGVELKPLNKIISGGEMSRFMLAFKSIQNSNTRKTCIFDEIDTGIGGEIGVEIGKKICNISQNNQVICITHLSQIACFGDANFKIEKYEDENLTHTGVRLLNDDEKITEIARMLGSSSKESSNAHAKEIIDEAIAYKKLIKKA